METIDKIMQRSAERVVSMEEREARKILKAYREARQAMKNRLLTTPDNTFTETVLESRLVQVEQGISILESRLNDTIYFGFEALSDQGIEDSVSEVRKMERQFIGAVSRIDLDTILDSTERRNYLFNQYESSIKSYNNSMRNGFRNIMTQGLIQNKSWSQIVGDIDNAFSLNEYKIARIVRTELHTIYNISKMDGFGEVQKKYIPDLKKAIFHPMDKRTGDDSKQAAKQIDAIPIDKPFEYKYNGKTVTFMAPPDRPNDRGILMPWRESYANA